MEKIVKTLQRSEDNADRLQTASVVLINSTKPRGNQEPFGYFRAEPFGWTDCGEKDEGAVALYDQETVNALQERCDELFAALNGMPEVFGDEFGMGDSDICDKARAAVVKAKDGESPNRNDGWISVLDRLPERFLQVLVTVEEDGERFVEIDAYQVNDWCSPSDDRKVTNWRPLPEPAAEQKGTAE